MSEVALATWDQLALAWFVASWVGYTWFADWRSRRGDTLMSVTHHWRQRWLHYMLTREMRMPDIQILAIVVRSALFFASTTMLILAGLAALLGATHSAIALVSSLPYTRIVTQEWWEMVLLLLFAIFVYAFFKFTWSMRQFNYVAYLIGAAPGAEADEQTRRDFTDIAGEVATLATRHFNRGLRAYYFGLAVLPWFVHPLFFGITTTGVVLVLYAREFHSQTLASLRKVARLPAPRSEPPPPRAPGEDGQS